MAAFVWGSGGEMLTPEQARQRQIAEALIAKGTDTSPVQHPMQGLARVAQAMLGAYDEKQLLKQAKEEDQQAYDLGMSGYKSLLGGGSSPAAMTAAPAPVPTEAPFKTSIGPSVPDPTGPSSDAFRSQNAMGGIDPKDMDTAVRTALAEAGNQGPQGLQAVAAVLRNRAQAAGTTVGQEALKPNQFEPWNPGSGNDPRRFDPQSPEYQAAYKAILPVLTGQADDPTGGATFFYAPKAQAALGREKPSWDNGTGAAIGDHLFFKLPYGSGGQVAQAPQPSVAPNQVASADPSFVPRTVPGPNPVAPDQAPAPQGPVPDPAPVAPVAIKANVPQAPGVQPAPAPQTPVQKVAQAMPQAPVPVGLSPERMKVVESLIAQGRANPRLRPYIAQQLSIIQQQETQAQARAWDQYKTERGWAHDAQVREGEHAFTQGQADRQWAREQPYKDSASAVASGQLDVARGNLKATQDRLTMDQNTPQAVAPGTTLVSKTTHEPVFTAPAAPTTDIQQYEYAVKQGFKGSFEDFQTEMKKASQPNTIINNAVNPVVKGIGDQFVEDRAGARAAADTIRTIHEARALVDQGIYNGAGADRQLDFAKLGKAFNIADSDKIANTEAFRSAIGQSVLNQAKALGANPSEGDRKFIQDVMAGNIALDERSIRKIMDIQENLARGKIGRYNEQAKKLTDTMPELQQFGGILGVDDPGPYQPPAQPAPPAPAPPPVAPAPAPAPAPTVGIPPAPKGVDPNDWQFMTPQERALWK